MKKYKKHLIFWIAYFTFCYLSDLVVDKGTTPVTELLVFITNNVYLFYATYFFLTKISFANFTSGAKTILHFCCFVSVFFLVRYLVRYQLLAVYFDKDFGLTPIKEWAVHGILWIVNYFFIASAYYYFESSNKMLKERLQYEKEKLELENTLLKAQINPHFLHNALSFLYAKSLPVSGELSTGILRLSEIMRYSIKPSGEGGLGELADEVEHIQNVIGIAQLRFYPDVYIDFGVHDEISEIRILPFVLITIVENILKHGVIGQREHPARIRLHITDEREIVFTTWNKKRVGPKEKSTSIGLENTRKRLKAEYGNHYSLVIKETEEDFSVDLRIRLKPQTEAAARPPVHKLQMAGG